MQLFVGTSGYSYKEWKGSFYPVKLPAAEMLAYYATKFAAVELNNTFYRMPSASVLEGNAAQVPENFQFSIKAPQTITHRKRLNGVEGDVEFLVGAVKAFQKKQGPILFGLPPNFKKNIERLEGLLKLLGGKTQATFEFRHESWFDDEVYDSLRRHSCPLCIADTEEMPDPSVVSTADWGYLRLRRDNYTVPQLRKWVKAIAAQDWKSAYVFFKHEDTGTGPKFATKFLELAREAGISPPT